MSETAIVTGRDTKNGRFVAGNSGNGGRPLGARNKLGEAFIEDLRSVWKTHGKQALIDCAETEPAQFARIMASLLPKQIEVDATLSVFSELTTAEEVLALVAEEIGEEAARALADALDRNEMLTIDADPAHD